MADLYKHLSSELEMSKSSKEFKECLEVIDKLIKSCNNYEEYILQLNLIYNKYNNSQNDSEIELLKWIAEINWPYNLRPEWRDKIKPINYQLSFKIADNSKDDFEEYLKEEKLLNKFNNEKYIIRPLVFNNKYTLENRERNIQKYLDIIKNYESIYEFVSSSIELQVQGFLKHDDELYKSINKLRDERVLIYQDLINEISKSELFKNLTEKQKNELAEIYDNIMLIWSEGNNCDYLEKAREFYKPNLKVKFYDGGGKNELVGYFKKLIKNDYKIKNIFLFDFDANKEFSECDIQKTQYIIPILLKENIHNNKIKAGIENLFDENLFIPEVYDKIVEKDKYGGKIDRLKFNKDKFKKFICNERNNKEDFVNFILVLNEIERLIG